MYAYVKMIASQDHGIVASRDSKRCGTTNNEAEKVYTPFSESKIASVNIAL